MCDNINKNNCTMLTIAEIKHNIKRLKKNYKTITSKKYLKKIIKTINSTNDITLFYNYRIIVFRTNNLKLLHKFQLLNNGKKISCNTPIEFMQRKEYLTNCKKLLIKIKKQTHYKYLNKMLIDDIENDINKINHDLNVLKLDIASYKVSNERFISLPKITSKMVTDELINDAKLFKKEMKKDKLKKNKSF